MYSPADPQLALHAQQHSYFAIMYAHFQACCFKKLKNTKITSFSTNLVYLFLG